VTTYVITVSQSELLDVALLLERGITNPSYNPEAIMREAVNWLRALCAIEQNASTVSAGSFS
jgi:hypothetical protein